MGKVNAKKRQKGKLQRTERTAFSEQQKATEIPKGKNWIQITKTETLPCLKEN